MNLAWVTDLHFDRMDKGDHMEFADNIKEIHADGLIITGDIGESPVTPDYLRFLDEKLSLPVYFILGNHDFWHSTFDDVRETIGHLSKERENLIWMSAEDVIQLSSSTAMIGYEGWGDGRVGDVDNLPMWPRDFNFIKDLAALNKNKRIDKLNALGDEAAEQIRAKLERAVKTYSEIYLLTHVPPFREACIDSYRICDDKKIPFYCCKAIGDVLLDVMEKNPQVNLTALCGHTHFECDLRVRDNLRVRVGEAGYGTWYPPKIIKIQ